ncbi:MAG: mechanosensitive ion channel family protein [Kofleriaceae bacterium]
MFWDELPWVIGLFVAVVITAALVNRLRPQHKRRVRRLVVVFALYTIAIGIALAFHAIDRPTWSSSIAVAAEVLQAYLLVMLAGTLVFTVVLPSVVAELPMIASDLIVGLGVIAATLVILSRNGMNPTNALVSGAVVSAVLAISLQSTLGNILGGIALQLDGSVQAGDWIQFDNARVGRVRAVRWRHTVVETRDFTTIIVPNSQLLAQSITILGKRDGSVVPMRIAIQFNVDHRYTPSRVTKIVTDALQASPIDNVAEEPKPVAVCTDLAKDTREAFIVYTARYSILALVQEEPTSSRIRARIYAALRREGIQLSVPAAVAFGDTPDDIAAKRAAREADERVIALRTIPLFQMLDEAEQHALARGMTPAAFSEGETIFRQGGVARSLYILAHGTAEIRTNVDPDGPGGEPEKPVLVAQVTAPNFFGERGLMTGEPRAADVIAVTEVECFRLDRETFQKVLLARPEIANELSERLATRKLELDAARDGHEPTGDHRDTERERIRRAITSFFGL